MSEQVGTATMLGSSLTGSVLVNGEGWTVEASAIRASLLPSATVVEAPDHAMKPSAVSIGLAGGLQSDLHSGDIVIADRALRDEGTSYHYLPPARSVEADSALSQQIASALSARSIAYVRGASWTTDAPYRETRRQVETFRAEGVKTVEMEAAALFAVGQRLSVPTAAVFVIGDRLADQIWQPPIDSRVLEQNLKSVAEISAATLSEE
jgi:uridine phosphorylase